LVCPIWLPLFFLFHCICNRASPTSIHGFEIFESLHFSQCNSLSSASKKRSTDRLFDYYCTVRFFVFVRLSVQLLVYLTGSLFWQILYLTVCLFDCLSIWLFVSLTVCLFDWLSLWLFVYLTVCLFDCLSIWLVVYLTVCLFDCLSIWLFVYLTVCLFVYFTVFSLKIQSNLSTTTTSGTPKRCSLLRGWSLFSGWSKIS
jgi:hypothetical protein